VSRTLSPVILCSNCGQENPDVARFCFACGEPLEGPPKGSRDERRFVSVVFVDLVGFTGRAERLDPEDVRAVLSPYHDLVRKELESFGGVVEKFIGDAIMAVFGAPTAYGDDPERAVRAALAVRDSVREVDERDLHLDLQLRIAVNTGEALVSLGARPALGEAMVAGDVVNTASRLQQAAPVNGVIVGRETYTATHEAIEYEPANLTISVNVSDLERSVAWYREALGFEVEYRMDDIGWAELKTPFGAVNVGLSQTEEQRAGGTVPTFGVLDIEAARRHLAALGVRLDEYRNQVSFG